MTGPFDVFLSYSRKDNCAGADGAPGWVQALKEFIEAQARLPGNQPLRVFFDSKDIHGHQD